MEEEIEILQSIYFDDILSVDLNSEHPSVQILVYATSTDDEDDNRKNIILTLITHFSKNYPNDLPKFEFKNIKGILDEDVERIRTEVNEIANRNLDFDETSKVSHLDCYHYFHSACLATHMIYVRRDIANEKLEAENNKIVWKTRTICCPVCREPMKDVQIDELQKFSEKYTICFEKGNVKNEDIVISSKMRQLQDHMKCLFEKQKKAGGIIDTSENEIIVLNRPTQISELEEDFQVINP